MRVQASPVVYWAAADRRRSRASPQAPSLAREGANDGASAQNKALAPRLALRPLRNLQWESARTDASVLARGLSSVINSEGLR